MPLPGSRLLVQVTIPPVLYLQIVFGNATKVQDFDKVLLCSG